VRCEPPTDGTLHARYTDTIPAGQLGRNGDKLVGLWAGTYAAGTSLRQVTVSFAGTQVFDTAALPLGAGNWRVEVIVMRASATTARVTALGGIASTPISVAAPQYATVTASLDFATAEDLVLKGSVSSGGATTDLVVRLATIAWVAAAAG